MPKSKAKAKKSPAKKPVAKKPALKKAKVATPITGPDAPTQHLVFHAPPEAKE